MRGAGRVVFAAVLLLVAGTLNVIYGIGSLDDANIFVNDTRFIFTNLNTLGWVLIVLGAIQLIGGFSLLAGDTFGRVVNYPWWSLGIFFLWLWIIHGILIYGEDARANDRSGACRPGVLDADLKRTWQAR